MSSFSTRADGCVLCRSQRSEQTHSEHPENDDEEFLDDRTANQGRHILTLLTVCAGSADSLLTSVIPSSPPFYLWRGSGEKSRPPLMRLERKFEILGDSAFVNVSCIDDREFFARAVHSICCPRGIVLSGNIWDRIKIDRAIDQNGQLRSVRGQSKVISFRRGRIDI